MESLTALAPAKINLNLRILGRNDVTGYHDLESLMVSLTLSDTVHVEFGVAHGIHIECSDAGIPADSSNLAWKAAEAFLRATDKHDGIKIRLEKKIPHGAGLGGGSSDAATVLSLLNRLANKPLTNEKLETLGAQIGSDIPFFIREANDKAEHDEPHGYIAQGRGEVLARTPLPARLHILLLKPSFGIETARIYRQWASGTRCPSSWVAPQKAFGLDVFNDLEHPAFAKYILLPAIKAWLQARPEVAAAGMSGSGSSMFAILKDQDAEVLTHEAQREFGETLWTQSCETCG